MAKILLIDDDDLVRKTVERLLRKNGYEVSGASSAAEAVRLAAQDVFDAVISDIRMPHENGIEAIRQIKTLYESKSIRAAFLLITGYAEEDTPAHAIQLGINKFIFKPFDNELFLCLACLVRAL